MPVTREANQNVRRSQGFSDEPLSQPPALFMEKNAEFASVQVEDRFAPERLGSPQKKALSIETCP